MALYFGKKFTLKIYAIKEKNIEEIFENLENPLYEINLNETFEIQIN